MSITLTGGPAASARRATRIAIRNIRCENRVVSRYVFNQRAVREYRHDRPELTGDAAVLVDTLRNDGVALTTVDRLLPDGRSRFDEIAAHVGQLRAVTPQRPDAAKPFLVELLGERPEIRRGDPLVEFALAPGVRGIAEAYSGMTLRVQDVNVWVNLPSQDGPSQSQRWHRDLPEDYDIVKCFVYLSDVVPGTGPLQYARGSNTQAGRRVKMPTTFDGIGYRVEGHDVTQAFGPDSVVTAAGPRGTVAFADTRGVHRGGHAVDAERVVLQITYASQASCRPRNLTAAPGSDPAALRDFRLTI